MSKDLTKENSVTEKTNTKTTLVVEQSSLRGKKSKILVLGFMLLIIVGLFSPMFMVSAEETPPASSTPEAPTIQGIPKGTSTLGADGTLAEANITGEQTPMPPSNQSVFEAEIGKNSCGVFGDSTLEGCLKKGFYLLFHDIPALLLYVSAYLFNVLISVSLSSDLFRSPFVGEAWGIVRDLSNIFFILILLYIAIRIILDMGGSEAKKMIGEVVIIALLINFSMFFTGVIIDSSNMLALVFYNKINVSTKNPDGTDRAYSPVGSEKDVAGGLMNSFDPTKMVGPDFFAQAKKQFNPNTGEQLPNNASEVPTGIILFIILLSGAVMCVAAWVFFASGFFFLSRLIELWILIIFSPFAFMSSTVPKLSGVSDIGWKAWLDRLISSSFMAPIFMFFLYFIFMLISNKSVFGNLLPGGGDTSGPTGVIKMILGVLLPAILICVLLLKAKKYAKKGAGEIGGMVMTYTKMAGGLALMAATGGAAVAGRATIGRAGAAMANSEWAKKREAEGKFGSGIFRDVTKKMGSGSFDIRGAKIGGQTLASATGMKVGETQKGGFEERKKIQVEKRQKRMKELEIGENDTLKQNLNKTEMTLQTALSTHAQEIINLDKTIEGARKEAEDAERQFKAGNISKEDFQLKNNALSSAKRDKKAFMRGETYMAKDSTGKEYTKEGTGINISELEILQKNQIQDIKTENVRRRTNYAASQQQTGWERTKGFVFSGGAYTKAASMEAAHKIITEVKLDSGTKA